MSSRKIFPRLALVCVLMQLVVTTTTSANSATTITPDYFRPYYRETDVSIRVLGIDWRSGWYLDKTDFHLSNETTLSNGGSGGGARESFEVDRCEYITSVEWRWKPGLYYGSRLKIGTTARTIDLKGTKPTEGEIQVRYTAPDRRQIMGLVWTRVPPPGVNQQHEEAMLTGVELNDIPDILPTCPPGLVENSAAGIYQEKGALLVLLLTIGIVSFMI